MGVFLTDFGLARATTTGSKYTRTGRALGTPAYMSPEQARGDAHLTPAADVWSLGCVLYELAAGRRAFEGATPAEVIGRVLTADPPDLHTLRHDVPRGLAAVVASALARPVSGRYPTASALREDLDRLLAGRRPVARPRGRRTRLAVRIALVAAAALSAIALARPGRTTGPPPARDADGAGGLAARGWELRGSDPLRGAGMLEAAVRLRPYAWLWRIERGLLLWAGGRSEDARAEWTQVPPTAAEHPLAQLYLGLERYFAVGEGGLRTDEAVPWLRPLVARTDRVGTLARGALADDAERRRILANFPGWEAALLRAMSYDLPDRSDPAVEVLMVREYTLALDAGPTFAWALSNRGAARHASGDPAGALADFESAMRIDPSFAKPLDGRALLKQDLDDWPGAVADFDAALAVDPADRTSRLNRSIARRRVGDLAGALADCDAILALNPADARALVCRGAIRLDLDDPAGALADLDAGARLGYAGPDLLGNRGSAKRALGDLRGAIADFDGSLALNPRQPTVHVNRGNARKDLGDRDGALADYEAALALDPRFAKAFYNRGVLRNETGEHAAAVADYTRTLEGAPDYHAARFNRANTRYLLEDRAGAIADYTELLAREPTMAAAWLNRGVAKCELGQDAEALADWERALALLPPESELRAQVRAQIEEVRTRLGAK